jgi:hypothetical protein
MSTNTKDLIAKISQNVKGSEPPVEKPAKPKAGEAVPRKKARSIAPSTSSGKQAAFWLDDEDRGIFREVGMLLYQQGIKPSDNLILRAAIRLMPTDHRLVEKVHELLERDGRKLRHRDGKNT